MTQITVDPSDWQEIHRHLLPVPAQKEEAAFLFGRHETNCGDIHVVAHQLMLAKDFASQRADYLELDDITRSRLIKRAHDLAACLIEIHSHPGKVPAAFSKFDLIGLRETVPHMRWRLRGQPYVALVVADETFDALLWNDESYTPTGITSINVGNRALRPTNLSLRKWT